MAFKKNDKFDIYEAVTEKIIAQLEQGIIPWQKPWNAKVGMPRNLITNKEYQGMNLVLLGSQNYDNPYWLSYKQCQDKGGTVKKGEKGSMIVYWSYLDKSTGKAAVIDSDSPLKTAAKDIIPMLRYYTVFNANQCENLITPLIPATEAIHAPIESAAKIIDDMPDCPEIKHGFVKACFSPSHDEIRMPEIDKFTTPEHYYGTLFHELTHSTGHKDRLDRKYGLQFGDENYAKEELIAEMGAAFLCAKTGIDNPDITNNNTAYIQSWLKALKDDKKLVITAAGNAQKAVNYITQSKEKTIEVEGTKSNLTEEESAKEIRKKYDFSLTVNQKEAIERLTTGPDKKLDLAVRIADTWEKGNINEESAYKYHSIGNFTVSAIEKGNADVMMKSITKIKSQGMSL